MLIKDLEQVKIERDKSETLRIETIEINDVNIKALNQNLANLRTEVKRQKENLAKSEVVMNKVKGKLVQVFFY